MRDLGEEGVDSQYQGLKVDSQYQGLKVPRFEDLLHHSGLPWRETDLQSDVQMLEMGSHKKKETQTGARVPATLEVNYKKHTPKKNTPPPPAPTIRLPQNNKTMSPSTPPRPPQKKLPPPPTAISRQPPGAPGRKWARGRLLHLSSARSEGAEGKEPQSFGPERVVERSTQKPVVVKNSW